MASSLLMHKRINTTVAKAKALRIFIEPLLTRSKEDTTHSRRMVFRYLRDKYAVTELFRDIAPKITDRAGGYTRILKTGNRLGDNAEMCMIELVDFNEALLTDAKSGGAAEKKPRTRRGKKKKEGGDTPKAAAKQTSKPIVEEAEIVEEVTDEVKDASPEAEVTEEVSAEASAEAEASTETKEEAPAEEEKKEDKADEEEKKD